jgi:hypothetical protein
MFRGFNPALILSPEPNSGYKSSIYIDKEKQEWPPKG